MVTNNEENNISNVSNDENATSTSTDTENKNKKGSSVKYPSSELILECIKREHDKEDERAKTFDSRVNILITLSAALLAFDSAVLKPKLKGVNVSNLFDALPYATYIILLLITMGTIVITLIFAVRIIGVRTYKKIRTEDFNKDTILKSENDIVAVALIKIFCDNIDHNSDINNKKAKLYQMANYFIITSVILSIILYIMNLIIS
ncbi:hypothetical protein [Lysinibacillus fusiformis]|uniref:hypothetical protein n=1 Tax=Lysinibacillus fusiformis TaxID=28031 RepID=UPI0036582BB5